MLKLSLEDQIKFDTKEMDDTKANLAGSGEKLSVAQGNLAVTTKDLEADKAALADLKADCAAKAKEYEAKKALSTSEGAVKICKDGKLSFLQVGRSGPATG